jgi:hypothetical protein
MDHHGDSHSNREGADGKMLDFEGAAISHARDRFRQGLMEQFVANVKAQLQQEPERMRELEASQSLLSRIQNLSGDAAFQRLFDGPMNGPATRA